MPGAKNLIIVGDSLKVREFETALQYSGVHTARVGDVDKALVLAKENVPDGIVFILPVYWESVSGFVEKIRKEPTLTRVPIIYLGDFIESSDQIVLKSQGVHTMTLGPVPTAEAVRYILSLV